MRGVMGYPPSDEENANKLIMSKNYGAVDSVANMAGGEYNAEE